LIADPAPVPRAQVALQFFPLRSTLAAKFKLTRKIRNSGGQRLGFLGKARFQEIHK